MAVAFAYHVLLDLQVLVYEIGAVYAVGHDASHKGGGQYHVFGLLFVEELFYSCPVQQIQL